MGAKTAGVVMNGNEIALYGSVGASWWGEAFFTAATVRADLAGRTGPLTVRVNSGGGMVDDGLAIYTMLVDYPDQVHVVVDAMAASAASLIAMAGDTITLRLGALMLIHDPAMPWTEGRGTEADHQKLAAQLGVASRSYAAVYARQTGLSVDAVRGLMREELLMDGPEAVRLGFATAADAADAADAERPAAAAAVYDYRIYAKAPAALKAQSERLGAVPGRVARMAMMAGRGGPKMELRTMEMDPSVTAAEDTPAVETENLPAETEAEAPAAVARSAVIAERTRAKRIRQMVRMADLPAALAEELIDGDATEAAALDRVLAQRKGKDDMGVPVMAAPAASVQRDAREKFVEGATRALMAKARLKGGERNEFSGLSLAELAKESLRMAGERSRFDNKLDMVGRAFTMAGTHTTGDFGSILSNVAGKAALRGWEEAAETFDRWTRTGTLSDFKATRRVGLGLPNSLPVVPEGAEYTYGTMADRGETMQAETRGLLMTFSRQAIINDDLSILDSVPTRMGRAARRTVGDMVYSELTTNAAMSDGVALFHASHGNLAGTPAAPTVASLGAAKAAMMTQRDAGAALNIAPRYMIVPAALEVVSRQLLDSQFEPTNNRGMVSNPVAGMAELIVDARLDLVSTTAWYLAADPNAFDTIEVGYLDGIQAPWLEQLTGWTVDGVQMKVRIDFDVKALDWRTLYRNAGA
jgi:ATP-dependent protease ClpP protease subunit